MKYENRINLTDNLMIFITGEV